MCVRGEKVAAHQLLRDRVQIVVEHDDVIAVPADAAADVQQDLRDEHQHRADLVGDGFGRVVVAGVERVEHPARQRVAEIELVRADGVALDAEAEQLALDRVEIDARDRAAPRRSRRATRSAARAGRADRPACPSSRRESRRWSRTACRAPCPSPRRSAGTRRRGGSRTRGSPCRGCASVKLSAAFGCEKSVGLKSSPIPSDFAQSIQPAKCSGPIASRSTRCAAELAVERVQVEAMRAGNQRQAPSPRRRGARRACAPCRDSCRSRRCPPPSVAVRVLEPADVVSLPAVERDRRPSRKPPKRGVGVDAEVGVLLSARVRRQIVIVIELSVVSHRPFG